MIRIKAPQDVWAGLLFVVFGCMGVWMGRNYNMGEIMRMGPGYLPRFLSWTLVAIGLFLVGRGLVIGGAALERGLVRPQLFILLAIVVFGLLIERLGLAPAVLVTTILAALASRETKWMETVTLAVAMSVGSVILFIYALGQSMEKWSF